MAGADALDRAPEVIVMPFVPARRTLRVHPALPAAFCLAALAILSIQPAIGGQSAPVAPSLAAAIEQARALVEADRAESGTPGISAAVAADGRIVWSEGFGFADLESQAPARATTLYRIGSVSKPVTATAVVQLAVAGKLDLDAPVQRYVPSFPQKEHPVTTRQVAGHIAGIRHYDGGESLGEGQRHYDDVADALAIFQDDPLLFAPGERYSYSSYGWNLISAVVQAAAGEDFLSYMQANVFDPLALTHTHADDPRWIIRERAGFYSFRGGRIINAPFVDNSYKWAGGGFISSVEDLVRFGTAHLEAGFLPQEALDLLFTSQRTLDGEETGYGIGWRVGSFGEMFAEEDPRRDGDLASLPVRHHSGSSVGGRAFLLLVPERRLVVALLINSDRSFGGGRLAGSIAAAFLAQ
jgi:CubicO group peptidase (beta-lactamase class C family)